MSSKVALVLGFAAFSVACGGDSRSEGARNGAGRGGSGGVSGTGGTGGAGTAGMGGTMPMIGPNCPDEEPEVDGPCDSFGACAYDVCSDGHVKTPDLGGTATTAEMTKAVASALVAQKSRQPA